MNSKKKQTVAVAMATALGVSAMMSPVAVRALEEDPATAVTQENNQQESKQEVKSQNDTPVSEQGLPASEQPQELNADSLSSGKPIVQSRANIAFTDFYEAQQAIETALVDYPVSNATTRQEIQDFLEKEFVATGKLKRIDLSLNNIPATPDSTGTLSMGIIIYAAVPGTNFDTPSMFSHTLIIPRIPKNGEVDIDKANFPDDVFRKYVSDNFDYDNDDELSVDEINKVTEIELYNFYNYYNIKSLKGIEHFTALTTLDCSFTDIASLDVRNLPNLQSLLCNNTDIKSLDVRNLSNLQILICFDTDIASLDVRNLPNLQSLICNGTDITFLDVDNNPELLDLYCYNTNIKSLNVSNNRNLEYLYCDNTDITSLDVRNLVNLKSLLCYYTDIKSLDVSKNGKLRRLECFNTKIQSLDVSNNSDLTYLDSSNTGIKTLDVSNNTDLTYLDCSNTGIKTLDVSNNPDLTYLDCSNTPLACLNLGTGHNFNKGLNIPETSNIDLAVTSDSFDMTKAFAGIDISKVTNIMGAALNGNRIAEYILGKPITYTYDCGTDNGNPVILNVTLNLVKSDLDSNIQITGTLDTTYTGKPIDNPSVKSTGSTGAVTFTYEKWNGTGWEVFSEIPMDAGRYAVQAHLASDDFKNEAVSEKKEFTIKQAINSWKNEPAIADWTYGGKSNIPTASAWFGKTTFTYSDSKTGAFSFDVPTNVGTWYVKATVPGTNNYTGLESIRAFSILPKDIKHENITVSDINSDNDVKKLSVKDGDRELVKGTDYDVETKKVGNKITVTIIFKGNYAGTIERTYTVATSQPEKPEQKPQQDKPQEKPKDSTQANSKEKPKNTEHVKTGDTTQTGLFATLGVLSSGCIALLAGKKRKKKDS